MTQDTVLQKYSTVILSEDSKEEELETENATDFMDWGSLPTVLLLEIHKYLPVKDRLNAFSVCRNWRLPAFQVPLAPELSLVWESEEDTSRVRFLSEKFVHKVTKLNVTFNAAKMECLDLMGQVFRQVENNSRLQSLKIRCSESCLCKEIFHGARCSDLITRQYFIQ